MMKAFERDITDLFAPCLVAFPLPVLNIRAPVTQLSFDPLNVLD